MQFRNIAGRFDRAQRRAEAGQGRPARAQPPAAPCSSWRAKASTRHPPEVRRDPQGARRLPRHDRRGRQRRAQPAQYGKAGAKRWRGIRPTVRGVAMNPVDHPHGGGEGKSSQGNPHPVSPWGWNTKGKKTRTNKRTSRHDRARRQNKIRQEDQELKSASFAQERSVRRSAPRQEGADRVTGKNDRRPIKTWSRRSMVTAGNGGPHDGGPQRPSASRC
jgi:hypothetical protein